jgi:hypothetical protein
MKQTTDQNGAVHDYTFDVLGRLLDDKVSTLGAGVDTRVKRLSVTYATGGQRSSFSSYDALTGGGAVTSLSWTYNGLGQVTQVGRAHLSGGTGNVTYAYNWSDSGTTNQSRLTSMTYPGSRVITYDYGAAGALNNKISRVNAIKDGAQTMEQYSYLGVSSIVERDRVEPGIKLTYFQSGGSGDGGDAYVGLDRFDRIVDQRWVKGATDVDRFQYTYDRSSNRLTKDVTATGAPSTQRSRCTPRSLSGAKAGAASQRTRESNPRRSAYV